MRLLTTILLSSARATAAPSLHTLMTRQTSATSMVPPRLSAAATPTAPEATAKPMKTSSHARTRASRTVSAAMTAWTPPPATIVRLSSARRATAPWVARCLKAGITSVIVLVGAFVAPRGLRFRG
ncbi:hypothetical protein ETB97_002760 [Aspergillus alliaceus]|uniref:Uncharacterized protein n=1 Tax=Petromyces alliaceus TaxID=209559 RepID=A0A8H6A3M4_PETAA|nr:hypothetical protein ETB97_002760 [Aspergillus burnettii]